MPAWRALTVLLTLLAAPATGYAAGGTVSVVAAENFYADVARQIAGPHASVTAILNNPDQDPHLFEASPSVARLLSHAAVVVYNGIDYDPWMPKLLAASPVPGRKIIVVADLLHRKAGDNPHIWYDPAAMPAFARALTAALSEADPSRGTDYDARLQAFIASLRPVQARIAGLRQRFAGTPVTATEPIFGYMASAIGFIVRNERFQLAVMNGTEPRASDLAAFHNDLRNGAVRLLIYNSQATAAAGQRLLRVAEQYDVRVVGVSETEPPGKNYQQWIAAELDDIDQALTSAPQ